MTLEPNPFAWPALLSALNPETATDRFSLTVFVPETATVAQLIGVAQKFFEVDSWTPYDTAICLSGCARRSDLPSLFTALSAVHGSLLDTR